MHGELQPLAAKMTKAMEDSLSPNMRMVGSGLCMEKFEDNPVVYEHFAEVMCASAHCPQLVLSFVTPSLHDPTPCRIPGLTSCMCDIT